MALDRDGVVRAVALGREARSGAAGLLLGNVRWRRL